jgi:hypothetical protein
MAAVSLSPSHECGASTGHQQNPRTMPSDKLLSMATPFCPSYKNHDTSPSMDDPLTSGKRHLLKFQPHCQRERHSQKGGKARREKGQMEAIAVPWTDGIAFISNLPTRRMPADSAPHVWDPDTSELCYALARKRRAFLISSAEWVERHVQDDVVRDLLAGITRVLAVSDWTKATT